MSASMMMMEVPWNTCPVCKEKFEAQLGAPRAPKVLPCGHSTCLSCVKGRKKTCFRCGTQYRKQPHELGDNYNLILASHSLAQEAKSSSPASPPSSSQASPSASPAAAFEEEDDKKDCKKRVVQVLRLWCVQCDRLVDDDSASNLCLDNHNLCTITAVRARRCDQARGYLEALQSGEVALGQLHTLLEEAAAGLERELGECRSLLGREAEALAGARRHLEDSLGASADVWAAAADQLAAPEVGALCREAPTLLQALAEPSSTCSLTVAAEATAEQQPWRADLRPGDESLARLLLCRLFFKGGLERPAVVPPKQGQEAEPQNKDAEAQNKDAEAQNKDAEAQTKDAEPQNKDAEAQNKDAEAQNKDAEAQNKDAEAQNKDGMPQHDKQQKVAAETQQDEEKDGKAAQRKDGEAQEKVAAEPPKDGELQRQRKDGEAQVKDGDAQKELNGKGQQGGEPQKGQEEAAGKQQEHQEEVQKEKLRDEEEVYEEETEPEDNDEDPWPSVWEERSNEAVELTAEELAARVRPGCAVVRRRLRRRVVVAVKDGGKQLQCADKDAKEGDDAKKAMKAAPRQGVVTRVEAGRVWVRWGLGADDPGRPDGYAVTELRIKPCFFAVKELTKSFAERFQLPGSLNLSTLSVSEDLRAKTDLLTSGTLKEVRSLVGLRCSLSPAWARRVLQQTASHLERLLVAHAAREHVEVIARMPMLRVLAFSGAVADTALPLQLEELYMQTTTRDQLLQVAAMPRLRRLEVHSACSVPLAPLPDAAFPRAAPPAGLRWLRSGLHPLRAALTLARAHRATLTELQLVAATDLPYGCADLATELRRCGLRRLRRLVLLRESHLGFCRHEPHACADQKARLWEALMDSGALATVTCTLCDDRLD